MRRLDLVVGPNGAGKSTFVAQRLAPLLPTSPFVNADIIAARRWPGEAESRSYEAARIADETRHALIDAGESFIAETVFSHPSKLQLIARARSAGYVIVLHVIAVPVELSVARVVERVAEGGHTVPEEKVRGRCARLWPLVAEAITMADYATVYDNTAADRTRILARYVDGDRAGDVTWPRWTPPELASAGA